MYVKIIEQGCSVFLLLMESSHYLTHKIANISYAILWDAFSWNDYWRCGYNPSKLCPCECVDNMSTLTYVLTPYCLDQWWAMSLKQMWVEVQFIKSEFCEETGGINLDKINTARNVNNDRETSEDVLNSGFRNDLAIRCVRAIYISQLRISCDLDSWGT